MSVGPRIIIHGDEELGSQYRDMAMLELSKLKTLMGFQGLKQDVRKTVFEDGTVIRCQSVFGEDIIVIDAEPVKVEEEEKKEYEELGLIIVLRKLVDDVYDYWYWDLANSQGYHADPNAGVPSAPEIVSTWWSCEELEEIGYYTRVTPALISLGSNGCGENCGLMVFDGDPCCDVAVSAPDDSNDWGSCPCGGTWSQYFGYCGGDITCSGGPHQTPCGYDYGGRENKLELAGCGSSQSRTSNMLTVCGEGYSYLVNSGVLDEKIRVGPRSITNGMEALDLCIVNSSICGPYPYRLDCCSWMGQYIYGCGSDCKTDIDECTNWVGPDENNNWILWSGAEGEIKGGCLLITQSTKIAGYSLEEAPLITSIKVGEKETIFEGSWGSYGSGSANKTDTQKRVGYNTTCQPCATGILDTDTYMHASFSYSEISYGVGGWKTVALDDGRFAVLIPKLDLSASAISTDGDTSGSIASTTTALLRIVDDNEHNYELAEAEKDYSLTSLPSGRDDLGIKPNCWPRDLPLDLGLCGFHWLVEAIESGGVVQRRTDSLLTAFLMSSTFYAHLSERTLERPWQNEELVDFEQWVVDNSLESYAMYLWRQEHEEEISY